MDFCFSEDISMYGGWSAPNKLKLLQFPDGVVMFCRRCAHLWQEFCCFHISRVPCQVKKLCSSQTAAVKSPKLYQQSTDKQHLQDRHSTPVLTFKILIIKLPSLTRLASGDEDQILPRMTLACQIENQAGQGKGGCRAVGLGC